MFSTLKKRISIYDIVIQVLIDISLLGLLKKKSMQWE